MTSHTTEDSPRPTPGGGKTSNNGTDHGALHELVDRLREGGGEKDSLEEFISGNWQKILGGVVLALLCVWLVGQYRASASQQKAEASSYFGAVQKGFEELPQVATETDLSQPLAVIESNARLLNENHADSVYADISKLYEAASDFRLGKYAEAKSKLKGFELRFSKPIAKEEQKPGAPSHEAFVDELASFLYAKAVLEAEPEGKQSARLMLQNIARAGAVLNLEALLALVRTAESPAELETELALARELVELNPELNELVARELRQLGLTLEES